MSVVLYKDDKTIVVGPYDHPSYLKEGWSFDKTPKKKVVKRTRKVKKPE